MLVSEGGHLGHLKFFGTPVEPMAKSTFYFVIGILVIVDIVQSRYQRKLLAQEKARTESGVTARRLPPLLQARILSRARLLSRLVLEDVLWGSGCMPCRVRVRMCGIVHAIAE